ncbi:Sulfotransferase family protein [Tranquillimonas rosea]|uniref:Sulfotransferase family protein n=1 Tax=Tranquillimonas rosea TaxID=641238 RepID=A0A1H9TEZ1_9RHOB|nr:sulfotransferase [Tranquillimonas rosea]SER95900.1 Sulfotransferase family protein [Tranquillimonas rosea]
MQPDFIIGGAPKCGTTSLHQILHQHPDAWVARNEVYFFDADDPIAHGDFLGVEDGELSWRDPSQQAFRDWYAARFAEAPEGALIGEDTTTYLMSDAAPARIAATLPAARMIFVLRDPVARAHSQYWHLVRSGRTHLSFERALSDERSIVLGSTYAPQLRRFREALGPERVHVVLFEEFNADRQRVLDGVTAFLGLAPIAADDVETWFNRTRYPRRTETLLRLNRIGRHLVPYRYARHFGPGAPLGARVGHRAYRKWSGFVSNRILTEDAAPEDMRPTTRRYLERHLSDRNAGLSELLGTDLSRYWPGFTQ